MKERDIAKVYANSIINLSKTENFDLIKELEKFVEVLNLSNELESVLFSDAFTEIEKINVLTDISAKVSINKSIKNFLTFLITEKRIGLFNIIYKEVIVADDYAKGFIRGTIEGSEPQIDEKTKTRLTNFLKKELGKEPDLEYVHSEYITAGYKVKVDDYLLDASLDNQLDSFKKTIMF